MAYTLKIQPEARQDIQQAIRWYNSQQPGLGRKFHQAVKQGFDSLKLNPFFQVRYDSTRCLPLKTYPYMIHFTLEEDTQRIIVQAVFSTHDDPDKWSARS